MISKKLFGTLPDKREVDIYELKNSNGVSASVITYGATWQSLFAPDRDGNFEDVLIGFDDLEGHVERSDYQGQIVGRYANRICGGRFRVGDKEFDVVWAARVEGESLVLEYTSPEGSNGFPGEMSARVTYTLDDSNELSISYEAVCTEDTPINMTNHAYFNLGSYKRPNVLSQELRLSCSHYTPMDADSIPTGEIRDVTETAEISTAQTPR